MNDTNNNNNNNNKENSMVNIAKEHNFVSAVVYIQEYDEEAIYKFCKKIQRQLEAHFLQYEMIVVNATGKEIKENIASNLSSLENKPITVITVIPNQSEEQCINAGVDLSIGDYVYEFDNVYADFSDEVVFEAYLKALAGNDIVMVCPKTEETLSRIYYKIFNACSESAYPLRTNTFSLISRRALNRIHMISNDMPFRKAAYATCGLKIAEIEIDSVFVSRRLHKFDLAVDSLLLYTNFGYKFGIGITVVMLCLTICLLIYALLEKTIGNPIQGWTSLACIVTFAFSGVFAVMVVLMKYMTLLLRLIFKKQSYLIEKIDKM